MFGEKYSLKKFRNAEDEVDGAHIDLEIEEMTELTPSPDYRSNLVRNAQKAEEKLNELLATGQSEAEALNAKYDSLRQKVDSAVKALEEFERNELGMHNPE